MKYWLIATYKINENKKVEVNLLNQKLDYYLPKIYTKKINSITKKEIFFPGYIFIESNQEKYQSIKYTKGIKRIIKFGKNIPCLNENEINAIQAIEKESQLQPIGSKIRIGQNSFVSQGSFKGNMVKIASLPSKQRIEVMINFLGSSRKVNLMTTDLVFS